MDWDSNFKQAKTLLMGALDTVIEIAQSAGAGGAGSSSGAVAVGIMPFIHHQITRICLPQGAKLHLDLVKDRR